MNIVIWKPNVAAERQRWAAVTEPLRGSGSCPSLYFYLVPSYFCLVLKCPTCGKAVEWKDNPWRPFCSERCKLIDFGRWADGEYLVPGQKIDSVEIGEQPHTGEANSETDEES